MVKTVYKIQSSIKLTAVFIAVFLILSLIALRFKEELGSINIALMYLLPALVMAISGNIRITVLAALCGMFLFNFFFLEPYYGFAFSEMSHYINFIVFLGVGLIVAMQARSLNEQSKKLKEREEYINKLYEISKNSASTNDFEKIALNVSMSICNVFGVGAAIVKSVGDELIVLNIIYSDNSGCVKKALNSPLIGLNEFAQREKDAIVYAFENVEPCGYKRFVYGDVSLLAYPINTKSCQIGVVAAILGESFEKLEELSMFLEAVSSVLGMAGERIRLEKEAMESAIVVESEILKNALLSSVSHDLKTPLASILGSSTMLADNYKKMDKEHIDELFETIIQSSKNMERLISNLLDTARLEHKNVKLKLEWCSIDEIVEVAISEFESPLKKMRLNISLSDTLPLVWGDRTLLEQVVKNLLENALKYSKSGGLISIEASSDENFVSLSVFNEGEHIPSEELENIFEKFYRMKNINDKAGSGVGLFICKSAVRLHNGTIFAKNRDKGVSFEIVLPINFPEMSSLRQ